ncbi:hypothetical protein [Paraburkholderia xenovorans]
MLTNQPNLDGISCILRNHTLASAIVRFGQNVSRGLEAERHDLRTLLCYLGLRFSIRRQQFKRRVQACHHDKRKK